MTAATKTHPAHLEYVLRIADTSLILGQRLSEWCGHGPVIEEDIALTNIALDLIGQARLLLTHVGRLEGNGRDEDQLAIGVTEHVADLTIVELPNADFGRTILRNFLVAAWQRGLWQQLVDSSDAELAAIAAKSLKETRYHLQHAADWTVRLGDGPRNRMPACRTPRLSLAVYRRVLQHYRLRIQPSRSGIGPAWSTLEVEWDTSVLPVLEVATLNVPARTPFLSRGKHGVHTESLGHLLSEMQYLQRTYPGGTWWRDPDADFGSSLGHPEPCPGSRDPAISVTELGIVRDVLVADDGVEVVVTPTYSGCPATEVIERSIREALAAGGAREVRVQMQLAPRGPLTGSRRPLRKSCAPTALRRRVVTVGGTRPLTFVPRICCPRCGSSDTERLSQFGATACKALYRCRACREPFEYFKPL
jgi:ring-1,2-phenylacetyl-CoA epoxidase subunit PaaC